MPIKWNTGPKHYYISRRSLCDNCVHKSYCLDANQKHECQNWKPPMLLFGKCRECGKSYELHTTRKLKYVDVCPECQEDEKENE